MKIKEIHVFSHNLSVKNGSYTMGGREVFSLDTTLVKLVANNGLVGWGETCPVGSNYQAQHAKGARAALDEMAAGLIGSELLQPVLLRRRMDSLLMGHNYAKAAVDIAAYDLMGKHFGLRVADCLGGAAIERVPSYYALGIGEPDEVARIAAERADEGYPRLQIKAGGRDIAVDIAVVRKVWERVRGRVTLAVDANRSLCTRDALRLSRECQDIPLILEQPVGSFEEIRAIRAQVQHGIYLDEVTDDLAAVIRAIGSGLCDGFGMKVTRLGGLHAMACVRDMCEARSLPHTCDDCWGGDIIAAACLAIGATVSVRLNEGVWIAAPYIDGHYDSTGGIRIENGHIPLPKAPGLGIEPDEGLFGAALMSYG